MNKLDITSRSVFVVTHMQASGEAAAALQKAASSEGGLEEGAGGTVHVFQALQYMRKLCSHPSLVLNLQQPAHRKAAARALGSGVAGGRQQQ
jgi:TATA-binding protein-associated factor